MTNSGNLRLDGVKAPAQRVIFGVGNFWRIVLIVGFVVTFDLERQPRQFDLGLGLGEGGDVGGRYFFDFAIMMEIYNSSFRDGPNGSALSRRPMTSSGPDPNSRFRVRAVRAPE